LFRSWVFGLAVLSFVALYALFSTHFHVKESSERDCPFCSAVLHHPGGDISPPSLDSLTSAPVPGAIFAEPEDPLSDRSLSTPSSRAPPRA
jgi:hypothetical protein